MAIDLSDYIDVAERIREFREKYPEGTLQAEIVPLPDAFAAAFIAVKASAYRSPDDPRPGVGLAYEPVPGKTPYTKDSELQNAETSAWGRAIVAVGVADTKRGIASANEVRNRQDAPANGDAPAPAAKAAVSEAARNDAFRHILENPSLWHDGREGKKNPKAPDFKAKPENAEWGQAGEPFKGKPSGMALWLSDAPPGFIEALETGDPTLCYPEPKASRGKTVAEATAKARAAADEVAPPEDPF